VLVSATYHSGTPRNQHLAVARWHIHLRGLATAIHEISGLESCDTLINYLSSGNERNHEIFKSAILNRRYFMATINLRNVPDDLHRKAKARAAMEGVSLKQLILRLLEEYLEGVC